ncbi:MAG: S41 family peptidase [Bryobacteraceae bacterium]
MLTWLPALFLLAAPAGDIDANIKHFIDVFALMEKYSADPVPLDKAFYQGAIPGMLKRLDPHSVFFDPGQFDQLKEMEKSVRKGFGSVVSILPGRVIVLQTLPGTPSAKSGMGPGDEILALNNIDLGRLQMDQIIGLLTESRQNTVNLVVRRPGNTRLLNFTLIPEEMQSPSVERVFLARPNVGYIRVGSFDSNTGTEIALAIEKLGGASLQGLVLDLRNNPGGVMTAALHTASLFLKPGDKIVSVRGRTSEAKEIDVPKEARAYTFPVAVLINAKSASASEIVAGALQDLHRAIIVGEASFGKGLVQSVYPLAQNTGLALTTAFYYTPSGRSIQRPLRGGQLDEATANMAEGHGGIKPDLVVYPNPQSRLAMVIEATGSLPAFATDYIQKVKKIAPDFDVAPALLDELQGFLAARNIRPSIADWSRDQGWIRSRLKQEILNQGVGVEKGDEIEIQRDPVVQRALDEMAKQTHAD